MKSESIWPYWSQSFEKWKIPLLLHVSGINCVQGKHGIDSEIAIRHAN